MNIRFCTITLLILITGLSGCSKFRGLTRKDYALLRDPFVDETPASEATADAEGNGTGYVKLNGPATTASSGSLSASAPASRLDNSSAFAPSKSPVDKSGVGTARLTASTAPASGQAPASAAPVSGPTLSDFVGKTSPPRTAPSAGTKPTAGEQPVSMAGIASFLGGEAQASGLTETATELDKDFSAWANQQKQHWENTETAAAAKTNAAATAAVNSVRAAAAPAIRQASEFNTSEFQAIAPQTGVRNADVRTPVEDELSDSFTDQATPLIQRTGHNAVVNRPAKAATSDVQNSGPVPSTQRAQPPQFAASPPEFSNPFEESQPVQPPSRKASSQKASVQAAAPRMAAPQQTTENMPPVNPFTSAGNNPFADFDTPSRQPAAAPSTSQPVSSVPQPKWTTSAKTAQPSGTPKPSRPKLDSNFSFDSGWKPSHMVQP